MEVEKEVLNEEGSAEEQREEEEEVVEKQEDEEEYIGVGRVLDGDGDGEYGCDGISKRGSVGREEGKIRAGGGGGRREAGGKRI